MDLSKVTAFTVRANTGVYVQNAQSAKWSVATTKKLCTFEYSDIVSSSTGPIFTYVGAPYIKFKLPPRTTIQPPHVPHFIEFIVYMLVVPSKVFFNNHGTVADVI